MFELRENKKGFTLIEMMVSLSIFLMIFLVVIGAFFFVQRRAGSVQSRGNLYNEGRYLLEQIARDIRLNSLDYSNPPLWPTTNPNTELRLVDPDGNRIFYRINTLSCPEETPSCLLITKMPNGESAGTTDVLNSGDIEFGDFKFYVYPLLNPYADNNNDGIYNSNFQPRVTIVFTFINPDNPEDTFSGQTTISSRYYKR